MSEASVPINMVFSFTSFGMHGSVAPGHSLLRFGLITFRKGDPPCRPHTFLPKNSPYLIGGYGFSFLQHFASLLQFLPHDTRMHFPGS